MKTVQIRCYLIGQSMPNEKGVDSWMQDVGAGYSEHQTLDSSSVVPGLAARRCYMSFAPGLNPNISRIRKDWSDFFDNLLSSGHGSVFEHSSFSWAIEGVSRVFTGEMNRHRAGVAISEGSMRYIRFEDIPFWMPLSISEDHGYLGTDEQRRMTRDIFYAAFIDAEAHYQELCSVWKPELDGGFSVKKQLTSLFRRIIPMGVATGGVWTMNLRALRHILATRTSSAAEEEIAYVMSHIGKAMIEATPHIFADFTLVDGCWVPKYSKV